LHGSKCVKAVSWKTSHDEIELMVDSTVISCCRRAREIVAQQKLLVQSIEHVACKVFI
jgi:hypothetical protein